MDLADLTRMLEALREESRWRLLVRPEDADAARLAVIRAHLVPQVQVMEHQLVPAGQAYLVNVAAFLRSELPLWEIPPSRLVTHEPKRPQRLPIRPIRLYDTKTA
jgi:hypothetical protein